MELICQRKPTHKHTTFGEVILDGQFICYTLEDVVREMPGKPISESKITGETAIPVGRYRVTFEDSPRFGKDTITLNNVPGFVTIRVHSGNDDKDTEGCPLVGLEIEYNDDDGGNIVGGTSKPALEKLKKIVKEAFDKNKEVWWNVVAPKYGPFRG